MSESDDAAELAAHLRRKEQSVRTKSFLRQSYTAEDMLIARELNEAGYHASFPYHGGPYDETRFRLVRGGWDHDHCYLCLATINPGDEWWAAEPPDELGLCLECHERLFGGSRDLKPHA
jgi:hypothetical protein